MKPAPLGCRICHLPQGWRDHFIFGICAYCWVGYPAEKIIGLIPIVVEIKSEQP